MIKYEGVLCEKVSLLARMYARKRGRAGSKKMYRDMPPEWVKLTPEEVEQRVIELAERGYSSAMIGIILRDQFGVPNVREITKKRITQILAEHNLLPKIPDDLNSLIQKAVRLRRHLLEKKHRKDYHNKRALQLVESRIRRLIKYYKRKGRLAPDWNYQRYINTLLGIRK